MNLKLPQFIKRLVAGGIIGILLAVTPSLWAQDVCDCDENVRVIRTVERAYSLRPGQVIELNHRYGEIVFEASSRPLARVSVRIEAVGRTEAEAEARIDGVKILGRSESDRLYLVTEQTGGPAPLSASRKLRISYRVQVPNTHPLELSALFGDIEIPDWRANVRAYTQHGNMVLGRLTGTDNQLKIDFGEMQIEYLRQGWVAARYDGKIQIDAGDEIEARLEHAHLNIGRVNALKIYASLGEVDINYAKHIEGKFGSGNFVLAELGESIDLVVRYAPQFHIARVSSDFTSVELNAAFSTLELPFAGDANFKFQAKLYNCPLTYEVPSVSLNVIEDQASSWSWYQGRFGTMLNPKARVRIESEHGRISMGE